METKMETEIHLYFQLEKILALLNLNASKNKKKFGAKRIYYALSVIVVMNYRFMIIAIQIIIVIAI